MGFTENYLERRKKRSGGASSAPGSAAAKDRTADDFTMRYLALREARRTENTLKEGTPAGGESGTPPILPLILPNVPTAHALSSPTAHTSGSPTAHAFSSPEAPSTRTALERAVDAASGAMKTYGASLANAQATLYDVTQGARTGINQELLEAAQQKYNRALRDLKSAEALAASDPRYRSDLESARNVLDAARRELEAYGGAEEAQRGAAEQSYAAADRLAQSGQEDVERAKEGQSGLGKFAVDVGVGGAQLGADIAGGLATGGGTMLPLMLRSFGGGAQEARQEGADTRQAAAYGAASALTEILTEKISSLGNFNSKAFGSGALDDILEGAVGAVERMGKTEAGRKILNHAASAGIGFLSEGAEEFVSGVVSPLLKKSIYSKEPIDWRKTIQEAGYEFLVGGGIGILSGGIGGTNTADVQSQYLSGVTDRVQNEAYRTMAEKGMFSQEARATTRNALEQMGRAWERSGLPGLRLPTLEDLEGAQGSPRAQEMPEDRAMPQEAQAGPGSRNNGVYAPATQAEEQKNTAQGAVNENGLVSLTEQEQANLSSGKKNKIVSTMSETVNFIRNALTNRQSTERAYMGRIPDSVAQRVYAETGMDIQGYNAVLPSEAVRHIFKRHGNEAAEGAHGQVAVTEKSAALIPVVLADPDRVYLSDKPDAFGRPTLMFEKAAGNYLITAQAVTEGRQALTTDTFYIRKKASPATADETRLSSSQTSETGSGPTLSDFSVQQGAPNVNGVNPVENAQNPGDTYSNLFTSRLERMGEGTDTAARLGRLLGRAAESGALTAAEWSEVQESPNGKILLEAAVEFSRRKAAQAEGAEVTGAGPSGDQAAGDGEAEGTVSDGANPVVGREAEAGEGGGLLSRLEKFTDSEIRVVSREEMVRLTGREDTNGVQVGRKIYLNEAADRPLVEVAKHELTHRLQETAPESYGAFRDYVAGLYRESGTLEGYIDALRQSREDAGMALTEKEALDEIAADYAGQLLVDENAVRKLAGEDRGLLERLLDGLREIIGKIRRALGSGTDRQTAELEQAARLWEAALRESAGNAETADSGVKPHFSLAYDRENRPFVMVEEDILEGVPEKDWVRTVKDNLRQKFPNGVTVGNSQIEIDGTSRREMTWSGYSQWLRKASPEVYADKLRATNNAGEIIQASRDYVNEGLHHPRKDSIQDFARGTVQLRIGGNDYSADVIVGTRGNGSMLLYDLLNLQPIQIQEKSQGRQTATPSPGSSRSTATDSMDSISQTAPDVKPRSFSEEVMQQLTGEYSKDGTGGAEIPGGSKARFSAESEIPGLRLPSLEGDGDSSGNGSRYSMKGDADLQKEVDRLRRQNERLKEQTKRTDAPRRNREAVAREAGFLLKEYSSTYDRTELADRLQTLWDHQADRYGGKPWVRDRAPTKEEIRQEARGIAEDILANNEEQTNTLHEQYRDLQKELRTKGISIAPEYRADLESADGYDGIRKRYFGRLRLSRDGTAVDRVYDDLADRYPELFPDDILHPADQLVRICDVVDALEPVMGNVYEREMDQAAEYLAGDLLERFYDVPQKALTFADRQAQKMAEARKKDREEFEARLYRKKRETETRIKRVQEKFKEQDRKRIENQNATQRRETIRHHADRLGRMLLRPTDKSHVPEELRGAALKFVQSLNLESGYSRELFGKRVTAEQGETEGAAPTMRSEAARALQEKLKKLAEDSGMTIDPDMDGYLDELAGMGDTPLSKLGKAELDTVWKVMQVLEHSITRSNEMLGQSRYAKVSEVAERLREENGGKKERRSFAGLVGTVDQLVNMDMLTPETYFHKLGDAGEAIYKEMRSAADRQTGILKEGVEKAQKLTKESGVDLRKAERELHTFSTSGGDLTLSTAQVMELYALSKRDQALEHIYVGGLKPTGARKGAETVGKAAPVKVTPSDVAEILGTLTPEQRKLMDGMQAYLSGDLSKHGNEASMAVYGYEKFKEKNYWPIKVDRNQTRSDVKKEAESRTVAGYGMTKALKPHAGNAVVLRGVLDSYTDHLNQMSTYAGWLAASEDVNRVHNYIFQDGDGGTDGMDRATGTSNARARFDPAGTAGSVKTLLEQVYGKGGNSYLDKLMADIAMGTKAGAEPSFSDRGLNQFKAAKVGGNLRVILQQPTAIIRAANMLDPKYFLTAKNPMKGWKTAKKYAPIAQWKDWGYFEMDTGRSLKELIAGEEGRLEAVKNKLMEPAGMADSVAWGHLWNAVEAETAEKHKDLRRGSAEFYQAAAERFGEIIDRTQVVDSVLHRPQIMRSANSLTRMSTSFMSEPSKIYNMVVRDLYDMQAAGTREERARAGKQLARSAAALVVSFAANAVAQSLTDMWRDKDRDKKLKEKFTDAYVSNFLENFDPVGYVPYLKDLDSIIQGYSVDRSDLEGFSDVVNALGQMGRAWSGESKNSVASAALELACRGADMLGLPASNIKRDAAGIVQTALQGSGNVEAQYVLDKLGLNPDKAAATFYDDLYRAMGKDWDQYESIYQDMKERGWDEEKLKDNMASRMAKEAGLKKASSLPVEYSVPGENLTFDQEVMRQLTGGKTWMDALPEGTLELAQDLEALEPEEGAESVTKMQKVRELRDSIWGDEVKELTLKNILGEKDYERMQAARKAGVSIEKWCGLYENIADQKIQRTGKAGSPSQADVAAALEGAGLTERQKDAIWAGYGWKGERVKEQETVSSSQLPGLSLPSLRG